MKTFITKHRKGIKRMLIGCGIVAALGATVIFGMDVYVVHYAKGYVYETGPENSMPKADCILVLGAGMKPNGEPSLMLRSFKSCDRIIPCGGIGSFPVDRGSWQERL